MKRFLIHPLRAVNAAVGFFADDTVELTTEFFAVAVQTSVAAVAFKTLRGGVPVEGIFKIKVQVALGGAVGEVEAVAAHRLVHLQVERFAAATVIEAGADVCPDAVVLTEVAHSAAAVVGVQFGAVCRNERLANIKVGLGNAVVVADFAKCLVRPARRL